MVDKFDVRLQGQVRQRALDETRTRSTATTSGRCIKQAIERQGSDGPAE